MPTGGSAWMLAAALLPCTLACTWVSVKSPEGYHVIGRTMEVGGKGGEFLGAKRRRAARLGGAQPAADFRIVVHPRGEKWGGEQSHCDPIEGGWLTWNNTYGFVGIDQPAFPHTPPLILDGMNEKGLTVSLHTLRQSEYQQRTKGLPSMCFMDLVVWVLGTCATTAEAVQALKGVAMIDPSWAVMPDGDRGHWGIQDATGHSVVVEYLEGVLHVHNNTVGVMTNDPDFAWQLRNLNNYVNLQPSWPVADKNMQVDTEVGTVPNAIGHGYNIVGLPGDSSPPARFVNMYFLRQLAQRNLPVGNITEAITLASALVNRVIVIKGSVATAPKDDPSFDFTQYAVLKIPETRKYIYRGYDNQQWKQVDLNRVDFTRFSAMPLLDGTPGIMDVTTNL